MRPTLFVLLLSLTGCNGATSADAPSDSPTPNAANADGSSISVQHGDKSVKVNAAAPSVQKSAKNVDVRDGDSRTTVRQNKNKNQVNVNSRGQSIKVEQSRDGQSGVVEVGGMKIKYGQ